jgi:multisubunit Na+/H+ antiporter MnhE subunit
MKFVDGLSLPPVNFVEEVQNDKANWVRLFALISAGLLTGVVALMFVRLFVPFDTLLIIPVYAILYAIIFGGLARTWKSPEKLQHYVIVLVSTHAIMVRVELFCPA